MDMSKTLIQIKSFARRRGLPIIPIDADNLSIIGEPSSFYNTILESINGSKRRLGLSALYLGVGPKESAIVQAIDSKLQKNAKFDATIVLDAYRATRCDHEGKSSLSLLEKILEYDNLKLSLVDTRAKKTFIDAFINRFQKWNEISSTYHTKVLIFDNDVIMTGANLSDIYFDKRQDRYISIKSSEHLSHYLYQLLRIFGGDTNFRDKINELNKTATNRLIELEDTMTDSWIIPVIQHGPSGILDSDEFLKFISSILPADAGFYLSSGYFNPSPATSSLKLSSVLAPSESANGFHNGVGFLKYIPHLYSALHERYLQTNQKCELRLYDRSGWSFHAKGIWVDGMDDLYVHHFGSSNYNFRSSERDFETQLILLTKNKSLIEKLRRERESLWEHSTHFRSSSSWSMNLLYHTISQLVKRFL